MYRCIAGFAVLNVINAVFIQQTLKMAQQDHDIMLEQKDRAATQYRKELLMMFKKLDISGDGYVSFDELQYSIEVEPTMQSWMAALEIGTDDLEALFKLFDVNGDGYIAYDECVAAASKVKGAAKSVDMVTMMAQVKQMQARLDSMLGDSGAAKPRSKFKSSPARCIGM
jgi:Ca2+-binding EF-hand superfamily protein